MASVGTDSYTLQMLDKITAPLRAIEAQMLKVNGTMDRLAHNTGLDRLVNSLSLVKSAWGGLSTVVSGVVGVISKGVDLLSQFGHGVVSAARFSQQQKTSLDIFLGKGKGEGSFNRALSFGNVLPMDERDVVRQVTSLAGAGYSGKQLDAVNAALADVHSLRGEFYRANLEFHFLRLKNEAKPDARDVKMAAIDTGVGMEGLMKTLFKMKGIAVPKDIHGMEAKYDELKKSGKITGNDVANAILIGINNRFNEGQGLGTSAKKLGMGTLSGLITNLEAAPERFLMQLGVEKMAGIKSLMEFLKRILEYFNLATPQGQKLGRVVERLVNALFSGLDKIQGNDLEHFFESGVKMAEKLVATIESAWKWLDELLHGDTTDFLKATGDTIKQIGALIGQGIWEGLWSTTKAGQRSAALPTATDVAGGKEIGEQARRAGAIDAEIIKRAGGAESPMFRSAIEYLANQGSLPPALAEQVKNAQAHFGTGAKTIGADAIDAMLPEQDAQIAKLREVGADMADGLEKGARDRSETHSPSRVMADVGRDLVDGLIRGVRQRAEQLAAGTGEVGELEDQLVAILRRSVLRMGALEAV